MLVIKFKDSQKIKLFALILISLFLIGTVIFYFAKNQKERGTNNLLVANTNINQNDSNQKTIETKENENTPNPSIIPPEGAELPKDTTKNKPNSSSSASTQAPQNTSSSTSEQEDTSTPPPSEPEAPSANIAFYADSQTDTPEEESFHQRVVNYIMSKNINPVFHAGDLMEDGTQNSLDSFNRVTSGLRTSRAFYAAIGNNDRNQAYTDVSPFFLSNFVFPNNERWYSVDTGNFHIVVLDSAFSATNNTQKEWLENNLKSASSQSKITGIIYHHPTFMSSIENIMIQYGVDFVVSGHIHSYSHSVSNGIHYYTLSGQPTIGYIQAVSYSNHAALTSYNYLNQAIETITINNK